MDGAEPEDRGLNEAEVADVVERVLSDRGYPVSSYPVSNSYVKINELDSMVRGCITEYLEGGSEFLSQISYELKEALKRSGFEEGSVIETKILALVNAEVDRKVQLAMAMLREEMQPIFDMLKDPNLALSARVKSFTLE